MRAQANRFERGRLKVLRASAAYDHDGLSKHIFTRFGTSTTANEHTSDTVSWGSDARRIGCEYQRASASPCKPRGRFQTNTRDGLRPSRTLPRALRDPWQTDVWFVGQAV